MEKNKVWLQWYTSLNRVLSEALTENAKELREQACHENVWEDCPKKWEEQVQVALRYECTWQGLGTLMGPQGWNILRGEG